MTCHLRVKTGLRTALSVCSMTLLASAAMAQPPGGGGPPDGQGGPPPFGGPPQGGPGRPGAPRPASVADVPMPMLAAGLNLTADQKAKIAPLQQQFRSQRPPMPPQGGPGGGFPDAQGGPPPGGQGVPGGPDGQQGGPPDQDAQRAQMDKARQAQQQASKKIEAVLTESQRQALPALLKELDAMRATGIPADLYGDLKLTGSQKTKLAALAQKFQQQQRTAMDAARQSGDFQSVRETMQARRQAHDQAMAALTSEQRQLIMKQMRNRPPGGPGDGPPPPSGGDGPPPPGADF